MVILIGLFSGFLATFLMDAIAIFGIRTGVYNLKGLQVVPPLLGRSLSLINHLIYGLFLGIFANLIKILDLTLF